MRALLYAYLSSSFITHRRLQLVAAEGVTDVRVFTYMCLPMYACLEKPVVARPSSRFRTNACSSRRRIYWKEYRDVGVVASIAEPRSPRWSIVAAAVDEVEDDVDGRMKGCFVREKVEKTLTRRLARGRKERRGASWLFRISRGREYPGKETMNADADEEACQERSLTETNGEQEWW